MSNAISGSRESNWSRNFSNPCAVYRLSLKIVACLKLICYADNLAEVFANAILTRLSTRTSIETLIRRWYNYEYDVFPPSSYILDGGNDMYDRGNELIFFCHRKQLACLRPELVERNMKLLMFKMCKPGFKCS